MFLMPLRLVLKLFLRKSCDFSEKETWWAIPPLFMQQYDAYLIFGPPGSGKGTQGKILGSIPRFFHFACGDVFRTLDTRTALGRAFMEYSSRGELVPDEVTIDLWKARIEDKVGAHSFKPDLDVLVLDGIPRNVAQAKLMEETLRVRRVFHLSCPDEALLMDRMRRRAVKENRFDDANEKVIRHRLFTYEQETAPLLEHYGAAAVTTIDALRSPVVVLRDILEVVIADGMGMMPEQMLKESALA
jgi:adenylate kinase